MPAMPTLTNGQLIVGKTGFDPVAYTMVDTPSLNWTGGAGTLRLDVDLEYAGIAATGTNQAGAAELNTDTYAHFAITSATAASAECVKFKAATRRLLGVIVNETATTVKLFPASGGAINSGATDASINLAAQTAFRYLIRANTTWFVISLTKEA